MKKRIIFITHNREDESDGVWKKIKYQVKALRHLGFDVDFVYMVNDGYSIDDGINVNKFHLNNLFKYWFYKKIIKNIGSVYHVAYIRKPHGGFFSLFLSYLLSYLKRNNDKIFVCFEIPTYPYNKEIRSVKDRISNFVFDFSLSRFKKNIDLILCIGSPPPFLWGKKTLQISNGINIDDNPFLENKNKNDKEFIFVGVANLAFWHGYDRVISSIKEYAGDILVRFEIVGDNEPEFSRLKKIVSDNELSDYVTFHGRLFGDKLSNLLSKADVCVDALGRHRSGNNVNNSIKSKEYTARGIPFLKSHIDNSFGNEEFIYQISPDDKNFSVENVIKWRRGLSSDFLLREREYAIKNLTWEKQFEFLLEKVFK